jgi:hypothetical protein
MDFPQANITLQFIDLKNLALNSVGKDKSVPMEDGGVTQ